MRLQHIEPAVACITNGLPELDAKAVTYLATYPVIRAQTLACRCDGPEDLYHIALMSYAWMPQVLEIVPKHAGVAVSAIHHAKYITDFSQCDRILLEGLGNFLSPGFVGASKVLHFVNPEVFPIWDSYVENFRRKHETLPINGSRLDRYLAYCDTVHNIRREESFSRFLFDFEVAHEKRLKLLNIGSYRVSEVRAVEACAFELSRGSES